MLQAFKKHNDVTPPKWTRPRIPLPQYVSTLRGTDDVNAREQERDHPFAFMMLDITYSMCDNVNGSVVGKFSRIDTKKYPKVPVFTMTGVNEKGQTVCSHVHGFLPYFFCDSGILQKCPPEDHSKWCQIVKDRLESCMDEKQLRDGSVKGNRIFSVDVVYYKPLYAFHGRPQPMFRVTLLNVSHIITARDIIWRQEKLLPVQYGACLRTFEINIEFVIRHMSDNGLTGCGWTSIAPEYDNDVERCYSIRKNGVNGGGGGGELPLSICDIEMDVHWASLKNLDPEENPRWGRLAPMVIMSYDIEVKAARRGEFPIPKKPGCQVIDIGDIVYVYGEDNYHQLTTFCLGAASPPETPTRNPGEMSIPPPEVHCFDTEKELVLSHAQYCRDIQVDMTTGYNIYGFDDPFTYKRVGTLGVFREFAQYTTKLPYRNVSLKSVGYSNKAKGSKSYEIPNTVGNVRMDVMAMIDDDFMLKPRSKKLDDVAELVLGRKKKPVHFTMINPLHEGTDDDRKKLVEYVNEDAALPIEIAISRGYIPALVERSRVCGVPLQWMLTKGQQVKMIGALLPMVRQEGWTIPYLKRDWIEQEDFKYGGACVIDPIPGYYEEKVVVLDFASLYPSIMMNWNISHESWLPHDCPYREFLTEGVHYEVSPAGHAFLKREVYHGIIPRKLQSVLAARGKAKKEMGMAQKAYGKNSSEYKRADARQAALKILANSLYGFTGATKGRLPCIPIAESVTAYGRMLLEQTRNYVESLDPERYKVVYGDSVTGDTPVLVRPSTPDSDGKQPVEWKRIDNMTMDATLEEGLVPGKEYFHLNGSGWEVWTDNGWSKIKRVIKHETRKPIYRVLTHAGIADVTEDHGLLRPDATEVTPLELRVGQELLHSSPNGMVYGDGGKEHLNSTVPNFTVDEAFAMGAFMMNGSCGDCKYEKYKSIMYEETSKEKIVPPVLLSAPAEWRQAFFDGFCSRVGSKTYKTFDQKGKIGCSGLFMLAESLGWSVSINDRQSKPNIFRLTLTKKKQRKSPLAIKKIWKITDDEVSTTVYDLETENHHFHVGPGNMIVHNTDSVMVRIKNCRSIAEALDLAKVMADFCNSKFTYPIKLEVENCYYPWILLGKKQYTGVFWEKPTEPTMIKSRGITCVRRDNALFANKLYANSIHSLFAWDPAAGEGKGGLIEVVKDPVSGEILKHGWDLSNMTLIGDNINPTIEMIHKKLEDLYEGNIPIEELVISQMFSRPVDKYKTNLPHIGLIKRMRKRDAGSAPQLGDRVPYVVLKGLKGDKLFQRTEDPLYAMDNNLPLDINYYDKVQCRQPLARLFAPIFANRMGVSYQPVEEDEDEILARDRDERDDEWWEHFDDDVDDIPQPTGKSWFMELEEAFSNGKAIPSRFVVRDHSESHSTFDLMKEAQENILDPIVHAAKALFPFIRKRKIQPPSQNSPFHRFLKKNQHVSFVKDPWKPNKRKTSDNEKVAKSNKRSRGNRINKRKTTRKNREVGKRLKKESVVTRGERSLLDAFLSKAK
jgi:DNA polymerase elongation subunit (family B)